MFAPFCLIGIYVCIEPLFLQLFSKMAPWVGQDTQRVFLKIFSELCSNTIFSVRKLCASRLGDFCTVVEMEAYEQVLVSTFADISLVFVELNR